MPPKIRSGFSAFLFVLDFAIRLLWLRGRPYNLQVRI